jgi:hypothetical protein
VTRITLLPIPFQKYILSLFFPAEPAFGRLGFTATRRERVTIGGQSFDRCEMEMRLD